MKIKFSKSPVMMLAKLALAGLLCLVIVFIVHSNYKSRQGSRIELKSRYTFSVRIDSDGNVLDEAYNEGEKSEYQEFETPQLSKMADTVYGTVYPEVSAVVKGTAKGFM